jgi:hypothetical protein
MATNEEKNIDDNRIIFDIVSFCVSLGAAFASNKEATEDFAILLLCKEGCRERDPTRLNEICVFGRNRKKRPILFSKMFALTSLRWLIDETS